MKHQHTREEAASNCWRLPHLHFSPFFSSLQRQREIKSSPACVSVPHHHLERIPSTRCSTRKPIPFGPRVHHLFLGYTHFFFFFLSDHVTKISMCFRVGGKVLFDFICRLPSIFFFCTSLVIPLKEEMKFSFVFYFCVLVTTAFRRLSFSRSSRLHPARMQVLREEEEQDKKIWVDFRFWFSSSFLSGLTIKSYRDSGSVPIDKVIDCR